MPKALLSLKPGGPETLVLSEVDAPEPGQNEVRVSVEACGVNYPDVLIIEDRYQFRPERPFAPGGEIVGRIAAVGPGVTSLKIGDRVVGGCASGGMAEEIVMAADRCHVVPDTMPKEIAASFYMAHGTSQHALKDRAKIQPGETLLVLGAAGGVGLAAVELGKAYGARVIAAVSNAEKAAVAKSRGADETLIYPIGSLERPAQRGLTDRIKALTGGEGADVVYDAVGGDYAEPALRATAWEGRYLVVGFPAGIPNPPFNLTLLKGCAVMGVLWGEFVRRHPDRNRENLAELIGMIRSGAVRPLVSRTYPLADGAKAIADLAERRATGKIVVTMN